MKFMLLRAIRTFALCACLAGVSTLANAQQDLHKTDWFVKAGYGVFVHYLYDLQNDPDTVNSLGKRTSWDKCVHEFDVERFARQIRQTGAGYVIFTMHQRTRYLIAPNKTFDRLTGYKPGEACATRDLVEDLYAALHKRGIPLMLYWTGDGPRQDPKASAALKYPADGNVNEEYVRNWTSVVREYGERYGGKVLGWWTDGCYPFIGYTDATLGIMADALRAGNPDRIVAMNVGVQDRVHGYSRHEDYTTGEQNSFSDMPTSRTVDGEQWHLLSFLGTDWARAGTRLGKKQLAEYVYACNASGGVVSIDMLLYRDGSLDRSQLEVMKTLRPGLAQKRKEAEAWKQGKAVPAGNKAWRKPAALLSLKGYRLGPSSGDQHEARAGVDGDPATTAQAGGEYPWAFLVDLIDVQDLSRIVVTFGAGYSTVFDVEVSEDREKWKPLGHYENYDGGKLDLKFAPTLGRYIRVSAFKPDAEGQTGGQMSIAELEAY